MTFHNEVFTPMCVCSGGSGFNGGGIRSANGNTSGVLADDQRFELSVLTNPFQDQLQLSWLAHSGEKNAASIYSTTGQLIESISLRGENGSRSVNTENWTPGIYFLISGEGENQQTLRLIKQ